jgi:C-terminal processing protease CtpA/Prc
MSDSSFSAAEYAADFEYLCEQVVADYAYPLAADWARVRAHYLPAARACTSNGEFIALLEQVLDALADFHAQLGTNTASSPYPVPSYATCWVEWQADRAIITAVRPQSPAARAGLRAGQEVVAVNGVAVQQAARALVGPATAASPAVLAWALLRLVTGYRNAPPRLTVRAPGQAPHLVTITPAEAPEHPPLLAWHRLGASQELGYLRLHNSLGDEALIPAFDEALTALLPTKGLLLDLRDTPSGGTTTVARALISRFITQEIPYQKHVLPEEERRTGIRRSWLELASPRALPAYAAPVVVLADRWTGSMGEGLTVGLASLAPRVQVVGTAMAGLQGAVGTYHLPHTNIPFNIPTEQLYTVGGVPRELYRPPILVDLTGAAAAGQDDSIFQTGAQTLRAAIRPNH